MTNSKYANIKTKDVLVLGRGLIHKADDTTIYAEKMFSPNFTTFCLSLHYNDDIVIYLLMGKKALNFRQKTKVYQKNYN